VDVQPPRLKNSLEELIWFTLKSHLHTYSLYKELIVRREIKGAAKCTNVNFKFYRDTPPKYESSVIIYSPSSCCKPLSVSFFWTQRKIFWRTIGTFDFHNIYFFYYGSQWCQATVWFQSFFKISSFVLSRRKELIKVCNNLRVRKWWQNFHFWVEYPFKNRKNIMDSGQRMEAFYYFIFAFI